MFFNEILWQKFADSVKNEQNPQKLTENIRKLIKESEFDKNSDEILYEIDKILENMTENEQKEVQKLINELIKE